MEPWDDRGQSIQIGAVLIFAALILLLSLYQATIVPQQNEQVEFDHNQQVRGDLLDLRNALTSTFGESASRSVSIQLGTTYPSRVLAVNPPPVSGLLRTDGTADGDVSFNLSNAVALDDETADFWNGSSTPRSYSTGSIVYRPSYNEYGQPPQTVYDSTVLYDNFTFEEATITRSDQTLVDGSTISLVALNGSLQRSSSGTAAVDVRPVSASSTTVAVTNSTAGNISIRTATRLPNSTWTELLADESNVTSWETSPLTGVDDYRTLAVELKPGTYELRMAKAGVGTRVNETERAYMTDVAADGSTVPEDGSVRLTLEVRDAYNNPVAGVNVTGESQEVGNGTLNETEVATGDDGRAAFRFEAGSVNASADVPVEFNFTLPDASPTPFDPDDPEDVEVVVEVQNTQVPEGSGGGGGAGYSLDWTDAVTVPVPGPTMGGSEVCGTGSGVDPCSVVMQSETSDAQIGAPVGFGSSDTGIVRVLDRANATTSDGTARTTVRFRRAEGNATLWTQSAGANATRIVSTPSYSSFDSDLGEWGEFGSFQGTGVSRTSGEANSGSAVVLPGGDDGGIVTTGYNTTGAELVIFQYWIKDSDTGDTDDSGGNISIQYNDSNGNWIEADSLVQTGDQTRELRTVRLGSGAIHDDLGIRFNQTRADNLNDEWVIDDPQISVVGKAVGGGQPGGGGNQPPTDVTPPSISGVSFSDDGSGNFDLSFESDELLNTITVTVDGPNGATYTFDETDFSESGTGPFTYDLATTQAFDDGDGTYTATVDDAVDSSSNNGGENDAGSGLSNSHTYSSDSTGPSITFARADHRPNGNDDDVAFTVRANDESGIRDMTFTATRSNNGDQYNQATVSPNSNGNVIDYILDLGADANFNGANNLDVEIIVTDNSGNTRVCTGTITSSNGEITTDSGLSC